MSNILFFFPRRGHHLGPMRSPLFFALVALGLLLVAMETARPRYFLHDDNASWFAGAYLHDYRVLTETGRLAEVNWYQHGGEPFLQQGQTAVLYPPVYLGVALAKFISGDAIWAIDWIAALHLALGLVGFYAWMRLGGIVPRFAALGGLAWVLNPFVLIVGASWIFTLIVAAWLPWLFWALDRLLARPSPRASLYLGGSAGLLFLQGYAQCFAYAILFLVLYTSLQFVARPGACRPPVLYYLGLAALIGIGIALPLLLPMIHATAESAMRRDPLPVGAALLYAVNPRDILAASFACFDCNLIIGLSIVALYCPALLLLPAMTLRLFLAQPETRRTLLVLITLGLLALVLCTSAHAVLTMLPLFDKLRWPFKVFLFADFFLIAALVHAAASWTRARLSLAVIALTAVANASISLAFHDANFISQTILPPDKIALPPGMDFHLGRTVTFSDDLPDAEAYRYLSHAYATWYGFPSLGGYDPLVSQRQIEFSLYLDYPNFCAGTMTPDFQRAFENRAVRYWIVDARSSQLAAIESLPGMKEIDRDARRLIFEDVNAAPLAHAEASPEGALPVRFSGNSLFIAASGVPSPLRVSAGPTDGWWYRTDGGVWQRPSYQDGWLTLTPEASARAVEVTYFDARFRQGLYYSALLLVVISVLLAIPAKFRVWSD